MLKNSINIYTQGLINFLDTVTKKIYIYILNITVYFSVLHRGTTLSPSHYIISVTEVVAMDCNLHNLQENYTKKSEPYIFALVQKQNKTMKVKTSFYMNNTHGLVAIYSSPLIRLSNNSLLYESISPPTGKMPGKENS